MAGRKYQFMEQSQQRRAAGIKEKIPDIQKTLDTVKFLNTRKVCDCASICQSLGTDDIPSQALTQ